MRFDDSAATRYLVASAYFRSRVVGIASGGHVTAFLSFPYTSNQNLVAIISHLSRKYTKIFWPLEPRSHRLFRVINPLKIPHSVRGVGWTWTCFVRDLPRQISAVILAGRRRCVRITVQRRHHRNP